MSQEGEFHWSTLFSLSCTLFPEWASGNSLQNCSKTRIQCDTWSWITVFVLKRITRKEVGIWKIKMCLMTKSQADWEIYGWHWAWLMLSCPSKSYFEVFYTGAMTNKKYHRITDCVLQYQSILHLLAVGCASPTETCKLQFATCD